MHNLCKLSITHNLHVTARKALLYVRVAYRQLDHLGTEQVTVGHRSKSLTHKSFICRRLLSYAAIKYSLSCEPLGEVTLTFEPT